MKNENQTDSNYHGFLPPYSREKQIKLSPRLHTPKGEKIHLAFHPLRPGSGNAPQWEDWNCYRSILFISWSDCAWLLLPMLEQIFPITNPVNGELQKEFDPCFDNWIGKADWERWFLLIQESLPNRTAEEVDFLHSVLGWVETALTHTSVIVVESNL